MTDALPDLTRLGIGKVLDELHGEFPKLSISKIRYLESEGLVDPQRTASGYRKFTFADVERLRFILRQQAAPNFWPLSHIRQVLDDMDRGRVPDTAMGKASRVPHLSLADDGLPDAETFRETRSQLRLSREELLESSGLDAATLDAVEEFGLITAASHPDLLRRRRPPGRRARRRVRRARPGAAAPAPLRHPGRSRGEPGRADRLAPSTKPRPGGRRARGGRPRRAVRASAHRRSSGTACAVEAMREVEVVGVRVEMPTNQPLVLLRELEGDRYLPIWIGAVEASAIAFAQQGTETPRPLTHELMQRLVSALGDELREVRIDDVDEGVFYATLHFESGATVEARPSDSIALALRSGSRILCAEDVLDAAGITSTREEDEEIEKFREFLDEVEPEDFEAP